MGAVKMTESIDLAKAIQCGHQCSEDTALAKIGPIRGRLRQHHLLLISPGGKPGTGLGGTTTPERRDHPGGVEKATVTHSRTPSKEEQPQKIGPWCTGCRRNHSQNLPSGSTLEDAGKKACCLPRTFLAYAKARAILSADIKPFFNSQTRNREI